MASSLSQHKGDFRQDSLPKGFRRLESKLCCRTCRSNGGIQETEISRPSMVRLSRADLYLAKLAYSGARARISVATRCVWEGCRPLVVIGGLNGRSDALVSSKILIFLVHIEGARRREQRSDMGVGVTFCSN